MPHAVLPPLPSVRPSSSVAVQYTRPKQPPTLRDAQRKRLYDFEREVIGRGARLSLDECGALAEEACALYLLHPPAIKDGRGRRSAGAVRDVELRLPRWSRIPEIVLHEAAHCVVHHYLKCPYGIGAAGHGPEFVRVFFDLLEALGGFDSASLTRCARARGIRVDAHGTITRAPADVATWFTAGIPTPPSSAPTRDRMLGKLRWDKAWETAKGSYVCREYLPR